MPREKKLEYESKQFAQGGYFMLPFINIESDKLFKELIQSLIGMGNQQCSLIGIIVVPIGNNLDSNISLSRSWRTYNHRQTYKMGRMIIIFQQEKILESVSENE